MCYNFILVQCFLIRVPPSGKIQITLRLSHVFVGYDCLEACFLFQFCMDTVKKFCHTGKHALILRAGSGTLLMQLY